MLNKKLAGLLNDQINKEFYSAYLYLEINNYFQKRGLDGFAHWYLVQANEEINHAMKIYQFLLDGDEQVRLQTITCPSSTFSCDMDALRQALAHEEFVTDSINKIYDLAYELREHRVMQFLDWFIAEQAEEETNAREMITKLELFGESKGLYMLDKHLSKRQ